jgi:hypothetical protein
MSEINLLLLLVSSSSIVNCHQQQFILTTSIVQAPQQQQPLNLKQNDQPTTESYCGDLALSCIATCPAFKTNCLGTNVHHTLNQQQQQQPLTSNYEQVNSVIN